MVGERRGWDGVVYGSGSLLGALFEILVAPDTVPDGQELVTVGSSHVHLAGSQDLDRHPLQPDEVHGVLGVVAIPGFQLGTGRVPIPHPCLVLPPLLLRRLVATLAVQQFNEVDGDVGLSDTAVVEQCCRCRELIGGDDAVLW